MVVIDACEATEAMLGSFSRRCVSLTCEFVDAASVVARAWESEPSAILVELGSGGGSAGLLSIRHLRRVLPNVPVIAISPAVHLATVVQAMKLGAVDYLTTPLSDADLEHALSAQRLSRQETQINRMPANPWHTNTSVNPRMNAIREIATRVAATDVPVLISGESGVGKEVLARYVHELSAHRAGPFINVNCAAIPSELLESELFGHERGAFTGAGSRKPGMFGLASNGTIMLDEIGELASPLQAKLLHILQDGQYMRLGGVSPIRANARIVTATNRSLEAAVCNGEFRQDLFFRLNVVQIEIPPLRARLSDLPALCLDLLARHGSKYAVGGMPNLPDSLMESFLAYSWPGNVRQLENLIKQFLIFGDEQVVLNSMREARLVTSRPAPPEYAAPAPRPTSFKEIGAEAADRAEREMVLGLLENRRWNRKQVARDLNVSYKTLLTRLQRWQIPGRGPAALERLPL